MKSQTGMGWIFTLVLLGTCTAARGQSTISPLLRDLFSNSKQRGSQGTLIPLTRALPGSSLQDGSNTARSGDKATTALPEKGKMVLQGTVKDASGIAVRGVVVIVKSPSGSARTAVTDSEGKFQIRSKRYEEAAGNRDESPAADNHATPTDSWKKGIQGIVTGASGDAVSGVLVTVNAPPGNPKAALTDSQGNFEMTASSSPSRTGKKERTGSGVAFWALQGLMFGSAIAAAQTTQNCINSGSCTAVPTVFRARSAMYNVGLPAAAGIAFLSYEMKKHGNHWWFLPSTLVTAADGALTFHSVRASH